MQISNPRVQLDQHYSLKVADYGDNFPRLLELVSQGIHNIGEEDIDWDYVESVTREFIENRDGTRVFLVLWKDANPVGVLLGQVVQFHPVFKKTGITMEQLWWVDPLYRNSKHSFKLIKAYEEWAKLKGVKRCVMSHFVDPVGAKLKKYYEKDGYQLLEQSYVKEL